MTTTASLRAAIIWIRCSGSHSSFAIIVWNVVATGFWQLRIKVQHIDPPRTGKETKLVLQAHEIAWAVVGHLGRELIRALTVVVDDIYNSRIAIAKLTRLLNRRHGANRF
jgi:hypothetical protein